MVGMAANALIFDLDGTVWNSASWFATALARGDAAAAEAARVRLVQGGNIVRALDEAGMTRTRLLKEAMRAGPPPLFPGMKKTLDELSEGGMPLAVATSLPGTLAGPMLAAAGLDGFFAGVVHAGTCRTPKPHPRSIHLALSMLGLPPTPATFYIGDRQTDAEAASRAGISFAWMAHGYELPKQGSEIEPIDAEELLKL
jgi:HAD superfamily hydrolase (TIGR01509 family)